jgi:tripartite-type tricarboxylate transporter receptor subunit TctC
MCPIRAARPLSTRCSEVTGATVAQLIDWFSAALRAPDVSAKLVAQALYPSPSCGADFAAYIRRQPEDYARIIRELNIKGG